MVRGGCEDTDLRGIIVLVHKLGRRAGQTRRARGHQTCWTIHERTSGERTMHWSRPGGKQEKKGGEAEETPGVQTAPDLRGQRQGKRQNRSGMKKKEGMDKSSVGKSGNGRVTNHGSHGRKGKRNDSQRTRLSKPAPHKGRTVILRKGKVKKGPNRQHQGKDTQTKTGERGRRE